MKWVSEETFIEKVTFELHRTLKMRMISLSMEMRTVTPDSEIRLIRGAKVTGHKITL
jgi:hypothetical protein